MNSRFLLPLFFFAFACGGSSDSNESAKADGVKPESAKVEDKAAEPAAKADAVSLDGTDLEKGKATYVKICQACHQADGTGMGGTLGADFVNDKSRLAKGNGELIKSILEGKTGKTGMMPPQKAQLSEQDAKDVLAHIRATYGSK